MNDQAGQNAHGRLERARWRSRRGLLELELLLKPFALERLGALEEARLNEYEQLLEHDDLDVYEWLMRRAEPPAALAPIVADVRAFLELD
ncbi:MAG: succinate dehydrogenase assembly factor 2 [Pseudomonadota bacterium]